MSKEKVRTNHQTETQMIDEGVEKKGCVNEKPTTLPPPRPTGQGGKKLVSDCIQ